MTFIQETSLFESAQVSRGLNPSYTFVLQPICQGNPHIQEIIQKTTLNLYNKMEQFTKRLKLSL